jgi:hypothetical protein
MLSGNYNRLANFMDMISSMSSLFVVATGDNWDYFSMDLSMYCNENVM